MEEKIGLKIFHWFSWPKIDGQVKMEPVFDQRPSSAGVKLVCDVSKIKSNKWIKTSSLGCIQRLITPQTVLTAAESLSPVVFFALNQSESHDTTRGRAWGGEVTSADWYRGEVCVHTQGCYWITGSQQQNCCCVISVLNGNISRFSFSRRREQIPINVQ